MMFFYIFFIYSVSTCWPFLHCTFDKILNYAMAFSSPGDRPHQCHYCDRSFTSRDVLKKHMYVHTENRNFKCGECGKMFKRIIHVQQHLRIHSLDRSFRCNICEKSFKTQVLCKRTLQIFICITLKMF